MAGNIAGFPFWQAEFDEGGRPVGGPKPEELAQDIAAAQLTDLFVFSHGWNNDRPYAEKLYLAFFGKLRAVLENSKVKTVGNTKLGAMGVFWPSILWPDEVREDLDETADAGGAVAFGVAETAEEVPLADLKKIFDPAQHGTLEELTAMLAERKPDQEALRAFKDKLDTLVAAARPVQPEDDLERSGLATQKADYRAVFDALADGEPAAESEGGAAGFGDELARLWRGAKGALRVATFWQMKERAGIVGQAGLGPLLSRIAALAPDTRLHLVGHSFGARLVSYALAGLAAIPEGKRSPVKSLVLLQGAFSHFTFADELPHDHARKGDLHGMASRVDGPLLTTFSEWDTAVGRAYPLGALVVGQDAAAAQIASRWGAMGSDGAQAVGAVPASLGEVGTRYSFRLGQWINLDGNHIIKTGGPPSGAHSDIIHPEIAWAALAAAKIV
jgi:hypothetical protein